jgi:hypothetical protein
MMRFATLLRNTVKQISSETETLIPIGREGFANSISTQRKQITYKTPPSLSKSPTAASTWI